MLLDPKLTLRKISKKIGFSIYKVKKWIATLSDDNNEVDILINKKPSRYHKLTHEHLEFINEYLKQHQHRKVTIKRIHDELLKAYPNINQVSHFTLRRVLKV